MDFSTYEKFFPATVLLSDISPESNLILFFSLHWSQLSSSSISKQPDFTMEPLYPVNGIGYYLLKNDIICILSI
jgi:hypothetical protein